MPHCRPKSGVHRKHLMAGMLCAALAVAGLPAKATTPEGGSLTGPATPEELSVAKGDFMTYCSACHGTDAKGTGPVAMELKTRPADLTALVLEVNGRTEAGQELVLGGLHEDEEAREMNDATHVRVGEFDTSSGAKLGEWVICFDAHARSPSRLPASAAQRTCL